jgi:putative restriction endonuclease
MLTVQNPFYETMREVSPGVVVFSFVDTLIAAIGVAQSYCWESPKPAEFGTTGAYWENVGWKVLVMFTRIALRKRIALRWIRQQWRLHRPGMYGSGLPIA